MASHTQANLDPRLLPPGASVDNAGASFPTPVYGQNQPASMFMQDHPYFTNHAGSNGDDAEAHGRHDEEYSGEDATRHRYASNDSVSDQLMNMLTPNYQSQL